MEFQSFKIIQDFTKIHMRRFFFCLVYFIMTHLLVFTANGVDPDQTPCSVVSLLAKAPLMGCYAFTVNPYLLNGLVQMSPF